MTMGDVADEALREIQKRDRRMPVLVIDDRRNRRPWLLGPPTFAGYSARSTRSLTFMGRASGLPGELIRSIARDQREPLQIVGVDGSQPALAWL